MATGTLYGLGVGPGDPELITLKARRILASAPVIAYPAPEEGASVARLIADSHVPAGRTEIAIRMAMTPGTFPAADVYDRAAAEIGAHLSVGRDVAVLCEGDPFLYGSFMYLYTRIAETFPVVVVPGVSSLGACAAVAGRPLVSRNQVLTVVPAPLPEVELARRLAGVEAAAIMKVGKHLSKVKRVLSRLGLDSGARYVARVGMADEKVCGLAEVADDAAPYFSMILVRREEADEAPAAADLPRRAAILALGPGGLDLAHRIKPLLPDAEVHGLAGRVAGGDATFADTIAHLRALFKENRPIVGVCAAGILVRALAPLLADKQAEPPVVAAAEDGSAFVPLLGGHHGANRIARALADAVGGIAAVTIAGDVRLGLALDEPPAGWRIANPQAAKGIMGVLLAGGPVRLALEAGDGGWLSGSAIAFAEHADLAVRVTDRAVATPGSDLVLHPPVLVLGVGCERGTDAANLIELAEMALAGAGLAAGAVACVASLDLKMDEDAVLAVADRLGVPARYFSAAELEAEASRLANPSDIVFREVGCHGVAEGAALAAAGAQGLLIVEKRAAKRCTVAVARAPGPIDAATIGCARGSLAVVGIGPGQAAWRTPEATAALLAAEHVVGYRLYLDLVGDLVAGKTLHASELTEEESRTRLALDLAQAGKRVALIGSGDAGVYGLASLVFELMAREARDGWNRVAVTVAPGISALQAAAARVGAPLGHDFCAISLSDLMTPWADIERRLGAAAAGDFVVALYNPVSKRRRRQLARARDILLSARPPETPVVLARNLGRAGESVRVVSLAELSPEMADMLTLVLVGSSQTRAIETGHRRWLYTPRGYGDRLAAAPAAGSAALGGRDQSGKD